MAEYSGALEEIRRGFYPKNDSLSGTVRRGRSRLAEMKMYDLIQLFNCRRYRYDSCPLSSCHQIKT